MGGGRDDLALGAGFSPGCARVFGNPKWRSLCYTVLVVVMLVVPIIRKEEVKS